MLNILNTKNSWKKSKKFQAHDIGNTAQVGSKVEIKETKPISKN